MTPLERAARALYARTPRVVEWDELSQSAKDVNIADARAVLTAIREPSNAMLFDVPLLGTAAKQGWSAKDIYQRMIDAALAEGA